MRKINLDPDEVFLDSRNLPQFNVQQFEGRIEKPIPKWSLVLTSLVFLLVGVVYISRVGVLQIWRGAELSARAMKNSLRQQYIFPKRGIIYDRRGVELAWNDPGRQYKTTPGLAHLLGYVGYPTEAEMATGGYHDKELVGRDGVELAYNDILHGVKGVRMEEVGVGGAVESDHIIQEPINGRDLHLSVDARVQEKLYEYMRQIIVERGFFGGAGVMMNAKTGEIIALTSYPEYDPNVLSSGQDRKKINSYLTDKRKPFLDRVISGLYAPGSTVKPVMALAALSEGVIDPRTNIYSSGQIEVPNPYNPKEKSVFKDWKAHGYVDMRRALAVSSDVYFYEIGGGYPGQKGIGINKIESYMQLFGFGEKTGISLDGEVVGVIPSPAWKAKMFDGEDWRIGNTYHTAIGQYGFQVSPIQMLRAVNAVGTGGHLIKPTILLAESSTTLALGSQINIKKDYFTIVREGMRDGVVKDYGTVTGLNTPAVTIAAKTGTAELGVKKEMVNSWVTGFFPVDNPQYSFVIVLERGPKASQVGAVYVMRQLVDWLAIYAPEYLKTGS